MRLPFGYEIRMAHPTAWRRVRSFFWIVLAVVVVSVIVRHVI
jgi:hypothetical protein